ncbi:hypothetical protein [Sutcliffiella rhizosphaerae]|uniref:YqxM protein n=1 Tax=Sutcliffiella rhizosphaerae TaxID=2880967 RepID=A0ABM8YLP2_9BACI|nr:hypothetical protein [Sutcliffiella rhizosphaerae]CAG9620761.1 hypothetical protein BACCIP111883_01531 [Sutcliffiella rhizosphaerae]
MGINLKKNKRLSLSFLLLSLTIYISAFLIADTYSHFTVETKIYGSLMTEEDFGITFSQGSEIENKEEIKEEIKEKEDVEQQNQEIIMDTEKEDVSTEENALTPNEEEIEENLEEEKAESEDESVIESDEPDGDAE